jgi:hypothetical protein
MLKWLESRAKRRTKKLEDRADSDCKEVLEALHRSGGSNLEMLVATLWRLNRKRITDALRTLVGEGQIIEQWDDSAGQVLWLPIDPRDYAYL